MSTVYEIVTEQIVKKIEEGGALPWVMPWAKTGGRMPVNARSKKAYRGINTVLLGMAPYSCNKWASLKQVNELGGRVRKGERSTMCVFWKKFDAAPEAVETDESGETRRTGGFMLRYYNVFNLEQTEGIELEQAYTPNTDISPIDAAAAIVAGFKGAPAQEMHGGRAFYRPSTDTVVMPDLDRFTSADAYYATLFHELTHATGHKSRLDRETLKDAVMFGDPSYSREELVAEFGAAFLKQAAGITSADELNQSAAYIKGWLSALKSDPRMLVTAAAQAQRAADLIRGITFAE